MRKMTFIAALLVPLLAAAGGFSAPPGASGPYIQSAGLSTSWGVTSGVNTGAFNAVMGTGGSATWIASGTSGGVFRGGVQLLDGGGALRLYESGGNYLNLSSAGLNFNGNTIWSAANDGSGSGLDADTVDGAQPVLYSSWASRTYEASVDINSITDLYQTRFLQSSSTNGPSGWSGMGYVFNAGAGDTTNRGVQLFWDSGLLGMWYRERSNNVWRKVWSDNTDGSGSGLDADVLDGIDSSGFMRASPAVDTWINDSAGNGRIHFANLAATYLSSPNGVFYIGSYGTYRLSLDGSGNVVATGNVTAYGTVSDARLKLNIKPISHALADIMSIRGVTHEWDRDKLAATGFNPTPGKVHGVIAQEVQRIAPDAVYDAKGNDGETYLGVRYERLVPHLIEAIKELEARVAKLEGGRKEGACR